MYMRRTVTILNPKQTKVVFSSVLFDKKSYTIVFNYSRNMLSSQLPISNVQMRNQASMMKLDKRLLAAQKKSDQPLWAGLNDHALSPMPS